MQVGHKVHEIYPIIITIMSGVVSYEDILSNCAFVDNYLTTNRLSKVYWIQDAVSITFSRNTNIQIAEVTANGLPGSGGDPRVVPLVIMPHERFAPVEHELKNRHTPLHYPVFDTMHDAYTFALFLIHSEK